jgi:hypothetical protein
MSANALPADGAPADGAPAPPPPPPPPPPPFRGPAADSLLGERFLDVLVFVAAMGFAADVSQCLWLCGLSYRAGSLGALNDVLLRTLELQCGARGARAAVRESFLHPVRGDVVECSTQLTRAATLGASRRVRQLVQLGAPLNLVDAFGWSALHCASDVGDEAAAQALLDGKYEGRGASAALHDGAGGWTPLMCASAQGHVGVARLLLLRSAGVAFVDAMGRSALDVASTIAVRALLVAHGAV